MIRIPSRHRLQPTDLGVVLALAAVTVVVLLGVEAPRVVDWGLGIPFLLLLPGYAVTSALFPERPKGSTAATEGTGTPGWVTRLAISLALSAVVVASVGALLSATVGIRLVTVVTAVAAVTAAATSVAMARRRLRPPDRRADLLPVIRSVDVRSVSGSTLQLGALAVAIGALVVAIAIAGAAPAKSEAYTEFYLLTEAEDGSLVAAGYPTSFVAGEGRPVHVVVENHEGITIDYHVVVLAQYTGADGAVTSQETLDRFDLQVAPGERRVAERTIAPTRWSEGVRLRFLLYQGDVPAEPDAETADLALHRWINVVEA